HDLALAGDASLYEPAAALFERSVRAVEAGETALAWSLAASHAAAPPAHLDVHWIASLANPTHVASPWLALAEGLLLKSKVVDGGRHADAIPLLRYAARRFRSAEDWALLALTAYKAGDDAVAVEAGRQAIRFGSMDSEVLTALATGLYRLGEFVECEKIAQQL